MYMKNFQPFVAIAAITLLSVLAISCNKDGNLLFETVSGEGPGFGLELVYHKNPGFKPTKPEWNN